MLFYRKCALTGQSKSCKHRIKLGDSSNYYYISPFCRYRVSNLIMSFKKLTVMRHLIIYDIFCFWPRSRLCVTFLHTFGIFSRDLWNNRTVSVLRSLQSAYNSSGTSIGHGSNAQINFIMVYLYWVSYISSRMCGKFGNKCHFWNIVFNLCICPILLYFWVLSRSVLTHKACMRDQCCEWGEHNAHWVYCWDKAEQALDVVSSF